MKKNSFRDECVRVMRHAGARLTSARVAVINCIESADGALSAREIFEQIKESKLGKRLDQVTVYLTLEYLKELKLIHRVSPHGSYRACMHFGCGAELHLLMSCNSCGMTSEQHVPKSALAPLQSFLKDSLHFTPTDHCMQLNGVCDRCTL